MMQRKRAGTAEKEFAADALRDGSRYTDRAARMGRNWGAAAKSYDTAVACMPTVEALLGHAHALVMLDVPRPEPAEALAVKLRQVSAAAARYRLAIELGTRTGEPMPQEKRQEVEATIGCLERFLVDPDPTRPPCPLVADALRTSGIMDG